MAAAMRPVAFSILHQLVCLSLSVKTPELGHDVVREGLIL